ncbi:unnamed protein product [Ambrosiozyma monospora]|uniref:Unnamed protein product n=1 Tax=Ambrosiozyma monospora TaxID=43982 RepID=A0A9W6Z1H7_AMBMO|nr:unnamed protein product [Ambrosiozyma monospora]
MRSLLRGTKLSTTLELSAPNFEELQHLTAVSEQVLGQEEPIQIGQIVRDINPSEKDKNSDDGNNSTIGDISMDNITITQVDLDYGPTKRREALVELVNEERCLVVNVNLQTRISERMKVKYTVDRRTIKSDARKVAAKGLVSLGTYTSPPPHNNIDLMLIKSVINPPTDDDFARIDAQYSDNRAFPPKQIENKVDIENVHFFKVPTIPRDRRSDPDFKAKRFIESSKAQERLNKGKESKLDGRVKSLIDPELLIQMKNSKPLPAPKPKKRVQQAQKPKDVNEPIQDKSGSFSTDNPEHNDKQSQKRRRKRKAASIDEDDVVQKVMAERKRKVQSKKKRRITMVGARRSRLNIGLQNKDVMVLIRCVIILQSLSRKSIIDWHKLDEYFCKKYHPDIMRRAWPRYKKTVGYRVLERTRRLWEKILVDAIEKGQVSVQDLLAGDLKKMMGVWKSADTSKFSSKDFELVKDYDENMKDKIFQPFAPLASQDNFRDWLSKLDRTAQLAATPFMYPCVDKFDSEQAKRLFGTMAGEVYTNALSQLEDMKAIAYLGDRSKIKFMLTERLMAVIDVKFKESLFRNAARFMEILEEAKSVNKGIILSTLSPDGAFISIFNCFAYNQIEVTRIDQKPPKLDTYTTKSQERTLLECDFIISKCKSPDESSKIVSVPLPTGTPCSRIWIDLQGDFNKKLFFKSVATIMRIIVFYPGVTLNVLLNKLAPFLENFEVKVLLDWLVAKNAIIAGPHTGYWVNQHWYAVFGYESFDN